MVASKTQSSHLMDYLRTVARWLPPDVRRWLGRHWVRVESLLWLFRNIMTNSGLISLDAGDLQVRLYPRGQIARMLWTRNFEANEQSFVRAFLAPGMRVINIGANTGLYAVMASKLVGSNGCVHAFEPSSDTHEILLQNLRLNNCVNVSAVKAAIGEEIGKLVLRSDPINPTYDGHRFARRPEHVDEPRLSDELVDCLTVDDYFYRSASSTAPNIDLMIIDVEGGELAVLKGASAVLRQPNLTILLECTADEHEVEALLRGYGYEFWSWNAQSCSLFPGLFRVLIRKGNVVARRAGWSQRTAAYQRASSASLSSG